MEKPPEILMWIDAEGALVSIGEPATRPLSRSHEQLLASRIEDIAPELTLDRWQRICNQIRQRGPLLMDTCFQSGDGREFAVEISITQMFLEGRELFNVFARDVIERRRREEQAYQTQKLESLGVLAGGIAHDFNNLLMAILGNADLALMVVSAHSPAHPCLTEIENAAKRAADLCRQLLSYAGKGPSVIEAIDLNRVLEETANLLTVSISKRVSLRYNLTAGLPLILADPSQILQVLMNLVTNASEAIGERSGMISLTTNVMNCDLPYLAEISLDTQVAPGRYAYLEVSDTGSGMDREMVRRIFDPFFTTKTAGRGMGLAAVHGIVRNHRGAIKVYSELGKGTTFKILFPVAEGAARDATSEWKKRIWKGSGTILVVDDEEHVRQLAGEMLEMSGFRTLMAPDGVAALRIFREHQSEIGCVLLDMTMPQMDGAETFRELRRIREDVRVIISSGYSEQEVVDRFAGKGLSAFVQKPYQFKTLIDAIRKVVGG